METIPTNLETSTAAVLPPDARTYFAAVRAEQTRFLEEMSRARALLADGEGQLAQISAMHGRLTRQFFDAQRSIMQRRAEADAEVVRITAEAEEHSSTVLASALAHSAASSFAPPSATDLVSPPDATTGGDAFARTSRQAVAALSVLAARSGYGADSIARVVNEAFEMRESEDARFERQLQSVLDEWWEFEKQESKALLDDARARAAMRLHVAHLEACQIIGSTDESVASAHVTLPAPVSAAASVPLAAPVLLPVDVCSVLDSAVPARLEDVLAELDAALSPPSADIHSRGVLFDLDTSATTQKGDAFEHFWAQKSEAPTVAAAASSFSFASITMRVLVPIVAISSLLAAVMAWMG